MNFPVNNYECIVIGVNEAHIILPDWHEIVMTKSGFTFSVSVLFPDLDVKAAILSFTVSSLVIKTITWVETSSLFLLKISTVKLEKYRNTPI